MIIDELLMKGGKFEKFWKVYLYIVFGYLVNG